MKSILIVTASAAMLFSGLISCTSKKNMQSSTQPATTIKKDTEGVATEKNTTTALPPAAVEENFKREHMHAREITWAKQDITEEANYIVVYSEDNKKSSIIYSMGGTIIEERHEIGADQLPQNIYNAIKAQYPNYDIVSAASYKHVKQEGSYVAVIKPSVSLADMKEIELIVKEDGKFVGQPK